MVEVRQPDKKWIERKRKGEQVKAFLESNLYATVIKPFLDGTKDESIKAAYTVLHEHSKLVACISWHQALTTIQDSLLAAARDAEIDLENPPVEEEAPDYGQGG